LRVLGGRSLSVSSGLPLGLLVVPARSPSRWWQQQQPGADNALLAADHGLRHLRVCRGSASSTEGFTGL
jgi:hypothetical protein